METTINYYLGFRVRVPTNLQVGFRATSRKQPGPSQWLHRDIYPQQQSLNSRAEPNLRVFKQTQRVHVPNNLAPFKGDIQVLGFRGRGFRVQGPCTQ